MRIALLSTDFPSKGRPAYIFVEQLVVALANRNIDIQVIAPQSITKSILRSAPLLEEYEKLTTGAGKEYEVYRPKFISFGNIRTLRSIAEWTKRRGVERVLRSLKIQPDVLYGHFWYNAATLCPYAQKNGTPLFVACGEGDHALEALVESLPPKKLRRLTSSVTGVISVSSENKRKCIEYGLADRSDIIVLPNSVNKSVFHPMDKAECRQALGISPDDFVVSFVGGFIHRKGSSRVAQAIDNINDERLKAIFIGSPFHSDDCTPDCKGIIYRGVIDHKSLPLYMNASDVFVLPTIKEGCCNAIVEALSCGLPVISSNLPFNDDILDQTDSIRIDSLNINELTEAIRIIMTDKPLRESLSRGSVLKAEELSIDTRAKKIEMFIRRQIKADLT